MFSYTSNKEIPPPFIETIPTQIHYIWFGSMLPSSSMRPYQDNVQKAKILNPKYKVNLWTASSTMTIKQFNELISFCEKNDIHLADLDIGDFKEFPNLDIIRLELNYKNWAKASDIARISILHEEGGIYLDTDFVPLRPLTMLKSKKGMLQYILREDYNKRCIIGFMASIKGHLIYQATIEHLKGLYEILMQSHHETWIATKDGEIYSQSMIFTTSNAFDHVFSACVSRKHLNDIIFDGLPYYIELKSDNTWLKNDGIIDPLARKNFINFQIKAMKNHFNQGFLELVKKTTLAFNDRYDKFGIGYDEKIRNLTFFNKKSIAYLMDEKRKIEKKPCCRCVIL